MRKVRTEEPEGCKYCGRPVRSLGMCGPHYYKFNTYGDALAPRKRRPSPALDFVQRALAYEGDQCLLFPFHRSKDGYARVTVDGKFVYASNYICREHRGPPPTDEHQAAHNCGNGRSGCITKRHLVWKTPAENIADKRAHGTALLGERHHQAKLSETAVKKIRSLHRQRSMEEIAKMFRVSKSTISDIVYGKTWTHV